MLIASLKRSSTTGQSSSQTLANIDSGTTLAQIPTFYAEAIFADVPDAQEDQGTIIVPCDTILNVSFIFGRVLNLAVKEDK